MTTTEKIQELQNAIDSLQTQLNNISHQVTSNTNNLNLHLIDCEGDITTIEGRLGVLSNEDLEIHQEIHSIAQEIDEINSSINTIRVNEVSLDGRVTDLETTDDDLQRQIEEMDVEHHQELHSLALDIDNTKSRINSLEIFQTGVPDFVVLSEDEYEALGTPDYDTFYYTYEED